MFDYGYDSIMRSHAESLERLGVPRVDILLCHDIGRLTHGEAHGARMREFLEGGYRAMRELRGAGASAPSASASTNGKCASNCSNTATWTASC